jgi:hypothetical protein
LASRMLGKCSRALNYSSALVIFFLDFGGSDLIFSIVSVLWYILPIVHWDAITDT